MPRPTCLGAIAFRARAILCAATFAAGVAAGLAGPADAKASRITTLVISEIAFSSEGQEDGFQWVELFNGTGTAIDLGQYSLGWGTRDYTAGTVQLAGTIGPGEYFVIGGPDGGLVYDMIYNFEPDLPRASGGSFAGVALFDLMAGEITVTSVPIDAVIYGGPNGGTASGSELQNDPTAGSGAVSIPEPSAAFLALVGFAVLACARSRL